MKHGQRVVLTVLLSSVVAAALPAVAQISAEDLARRDELESFLEQAELVDAKQLSKSEGVTRPYKLTLKLGELQRNALWKNPEGRTGGFIEGWKYEIAAYRMDKHLDLNRVPPTTERRYRNDRGSCQLWVAAWMDLAQMTEKKLDPPADKVGQWNDSVYLQRAFDNLIGNEDRHLRNILLTEDWRMILIDHSRAFRTSKKFTKRLIFDAKHPDGPKLMKRLPREFIEKIKALDADGIEQIVGDYLTEGEIEAVLLRRDLILAEVDRLIAKNGEPATLY
jgi:hypothetical protein